MTRQVVFGQRPWLNKQGREVAHAKAREMQRQGDYDDIYLGDVLQYMDTDGSDGADGVQDSLEIRLVTKLLSSGLQYREVVFWYLWSYAGLTVKEIHLVDTCREHVGDWDDEQQALRAIRSTLVSAGRKLGRKGEFEDWDRDGAGDPADW